MPKGTSLKATKSAQRKKGCARRKKVLGSEENQISATNAQAAQRKKVLGSEEKVASIYYECSEFSG